MMRQLKMKSSGVPGLGQGTDEGRGRDSRYNMFGCNLWCVDHRLYMKEKNMELSGLKYPHLGTSYLGTSTCLRIRR